MARRLKLNKLTTSGLAKLRSRLYGDTGGSIGCFTDCCDCCKCEDCDSGYVLSSFTASDGEPCWDLTGFQEEDLLGGKICGRTWSVIEVSYGNYPAGGGGVSESGTMLGMPDQICGKQGYHGSYRLIVCCEFADPTCPIE